MELKLNSEHKTDRTGTFLVENRETLTFHRNWVINQSETDLNSLEKWAASIKDRFKQNIQTDGRGIRMPWE